MRKWEYKVENDPTAFDLQFLGQEGWELVAIVDVNVSWECMRKFYFKRELIQ